MKYSLFGLLAVISLMVPMSGKAAENTSTTRDIAFPTVASAVTFIDDFDQPRGTSRLHGATDLIGPKMTPLYAAVDGVVSYIVIPEASWGYQIVIKDADGWTYHYIHINNDTPGTDDGKGGIENAYAPGLKRGSPVIRGQLIGWMGDSGNAEDVTSHLHFEIHNPNDVRINPYQSLIAAQGGSAPTTPSEPPAPTPVGTTNDAINQDKNLVNVFSNNCLSGSLIKSASNSAVYYCGADGKRYAFPNDKVYFTWYTDFSSVTTVSAEQLASAPIGGLVTYKPGSRMVKITSMPNVYHVEKNGVLRWVSTPSLATSMYGADWAKKIDDLNDAFLSSYKIGEAID
ncbi:MAG: M23 family metallopeptidase [Candidatus Magasanikbacteria bacterium]|nr:M23 family metallopeptidase [Candidatus Magasanikbacteria bacterium]MCA9390889.1 M23 family metallopeptidase [Candidatus Magasanikbacteria bacterium]